MKVSYFDSSALTKVFVAEPGRKAMIQRLSTLPRPQKAISILALIEVRSALRRRERSGDLSSPDSTRSIALLQDLSQRMRRFAPSPKTFQLAAKLVNRRRVKALDAIQLATALQVSRKRRIDLLFVSADIFLLAAAMAEGLETWNPEAQESTPSIT